MNDANDDNAAGHGRAFGKLVWLVEHVGPVTLESMPAAAFDRGDRRFVATCGTRRVDLHEDPESMASTVRDAIFRLQSPDDVQVPCSVPGFRLVAETLIRHGHLSIAVFEVRIDDRVPHHVLEFAAGNLRRQGYLAGYRRLRHPHAAIAAGILDSLERITR